MFVLFQTFLGADEAPVEEPAVQAWVLSAQKGNTAATEKIYRAYVRRIYRTIRPLTRNEPEAEDVTQEAFVRAFSAIGRYAPERGTRFSWLVTVALNTARSHRRRRSHGEGELSDELAAPNVDPLFAFERERLLNALSELPDRDREIVCLRYGAELSVQEVADAVRVSEANVRKICERQRQVLMEKLT